MPGTVLLLAVVLLALAIPLAAQAGAEGSISGTVKDPSGGVITGATITVTNSVTGVEQVATTNNSGTYTLSNLPPGPYTIDITFQGFRSFRRPDIRVNVNNTIVNAVLTLGEKHQAVVVEVAPVQVETRGTQMGGVVASKKIAALPLNGRSYTDLLALQPGVMPVTTLTSNTVQGLGQTVFSPSGELNPGTTSMNGQRESANGFTVNGADVEEDSSMAAAIIPNLDSIAEFRILVSNFGAKYGEYSGGQVNVVTKSGTNAFHGDVFEFVRNTNLDARNFFSPTRGTFDQDQFGGTLGGPIRKSNLFFFADYQGTRLKQGVDSGEISVPSLQDRTGDLSDIAGSFIATNASGNIVPSTVSGPYWASLLSNKLGYTVSDGEPYYTPGCTAATCVFPGARIPYLTWSAPATQLMQYIPLPNNPNGTFSTSSYDETLRDDKGAYRLDANTKSRTISAYFSMDDYSRTNPYPTAQGGANVPGFGALDSGRAQLLVLSDTKTIGTSAVNEFHFGYTRDSNFLGQPLGGEGVSLASQGFETGAGTLGIVPLAPQFEGVESVAFNNFTIGADPNPFLQVNNSFEWRDDYSKVVTSHTISAGVQFDYDQINTHPYAQMNGAFLFYGTETGSDFADFLLGVPSQYNQNDLQAFYGRNKYLGIYAQDSWRARSNLTFTYGLRWDRLEPWYEKYNDNIALVPGGQSIVFPTAPAGILYPGDPGISRTISPPGNRDFAPRLGVAYSPNARAGTFLEKILGGPGKTSIRTGFGVFYTAIPGETLGLIADNAPYGFTYTSPAPPLFASPFLAAATGNNEGQRFPTQLAPLTVSSSNPDANVNWAQYEPLSAIPGYLPTNRIPYAEQYMLSVERQIGTNTVVSASYVGNQAHHLLVLEPANPGNPGLCLSLSRPSDVAPGTPTCGPFGESGVYTTASGQVINGTRGPFEPAFGSVSYQATAGNSNYSAFEASVRHVSGGLALFASYTYSKSIDQSSNLGDQIDPSNPGLTRGLSSFDMRHNFVISYSYRVPFGRLFHTGNRWVQGWVISGITRYSTGFPVTLYNYSDTSLLGTQSNGINNLPLDGLAFTPRPLNLNGNPRNGQPYFDPSLFSIPPLGSVGNTGRRFFSGPGINNYDISLEKILRMSESRSVLIRLETFNTFNHAQFYGPDAVDGNINSQTFGYVVSAAAPRLVQLAMKFDF